MLVDQKRTEPLITKAYNAFRQPSGAKHPDGDNLISTEAYINDKRTFRDTAMSGLRHA